MNWRTTLGVFVSGFVVYGIVATASTTMRSGARAPTLRDLVAPVATANADSGSRLKAEFLGGDDGSKDYQLGLASWMTTFPNLNVHPLGLYWDSQRHEECAFQLSADGKMRCLPTDAQSATIFDESTCTQLALYLPDAQPGCSESVPKYAMTLEYGNVCPITNGYFPAHVYPVGNLLGSNVTCYYQTPQGVCSQTQCPQNSVFYAIGAEIPATSFVGATAKKDP